MKVCEVASFLTLELDIGKYGSALMRVRDDEAASFLTSPLMGGGRYGSALRVHNERAASFLTSGRSSSSEEIRMMLLSSCVAALALAVMKGALKTLLSTPLFELE